MSNRTLFGSSKGIAERGLAIRFLAVVGVLGVFLFAAETGAGELDSSLDAIASRGRASSNAVGLSVAVRVGDQLIFAKGYGEADLEHDVPSTLDTVYQIASVTKPFTATAIMKLVEEGKLGLQDAIHDRVSIYDHESDVITLHHLLTHTSGLWNFSQGIGERNRLPLTAEEVVALFKDKELNFVPGRGWRYSNSGYFLLGLAIEEASGKRYGDYIEDELAAPFGLRNTIYCDSSRVIEGRARGYVWNDGVYLNAKQIEMNAPFSAGALCSTAPELTIWARLLFEGRLIAADRVRQMVTPVQVRGKTRDYAYGWVVDELDGHPRFGHAGSIAVLANTGRVDAQAIGDELAKAVFKFGLPPMPPKEAGRP